MTGVAEARRGAGAAEAAIPAPLVVISGPRRDEKIAIPPTSRPPKYYPMGANFSRTPTRSGPMIRSSARHRIP